MQMRTPSLYIEGRKIKMASLRIPFSGRSARVKLMAVLLTFTMVSSALTGFWIYRRMSGRLIQDAWQQYETLLKTACAAIDQQVEQMNSFSWQLSNDRSVQSYLYLTSQTPSDILVKKDLIASLKTLKAFSQTICDMGIYVKSLDMVITSESSFSAQDYYQHLEKLSLEDMLAAQETENGSTLCLLVGADRIHRVMSNDSVLVFVSSLPINTPYPQGFAFYHLQLNKLKIFLPQSESGLLLLTDTQGKPLFEAEDTTTQICRMYRSNDAENTIRYNGQEYGVMAMETNAQGLLCMVVVPYSQILLQAEKTRQMTMLIMGICMLMGLFAAVFAGKKIYAPLEVLLQRVNEMGHLLPQKQGSNEYALLSDAISLISEENHALTLSNQEAIRLLKNKLLPEWMEGRMQGDAKALLLQAQISLPYERVQAAILDIPLRDIDRLREKLKQNVPDWVEEQQKTEDYGAMRVWCAQRSDGCLLVLFNLAAEHPYPEMIYHFLERCQNSFADAAACKIGIGRAYGMEKVSDSLVDAALALRCGESMGDKEMYYAEETVMPSDTVYSINAEQQLMHYVLSGQKQEISRFLHELCQTEEGGTLLRKNIAQALLFTAERAARQAGSEEAFEKSAASIGVQTCLLPPSEDALARIEKVFYDVVDALPVNSSSQDEKLYQKLMDYLQREYVHDISLDTVGEALSMSPSYIGLIFRRAGGTSFLRALTDIRIAKAKVLLCETELTIREIGFTVGIENQNTFIRMFKKSEGITPGQYRMVNSSMHSPIG